MRRGGLQLLALNANTVSRDSIAKIGYEEWSAKYKLRHKHPIPAILQVEYGPPDPPNM